MKLKNREIEIIMGLLNLELKVVEESQLPKAKAGNDYQRIEALAYRMEEVKALRAKLMAAKAK